MYGLQADGSLWRGGKFLNDPVQIGMESNWIAIRGSEAVKEDGSVWGDDPYHPSHWTRELKKIVGAEAALWNSVSPSPYITTATQEDGSVWRIDGAITRLANPGTWSEYKNASWLDGDVFLQQNYGGIRSAGALIIEGNRVGTSNDWRTLELASNCFCEFGHHNAGATSVVLRMDGSLWTVLSRRLGASRAERIETGSHWKTISLGPGSLLNNFHGFSWSLGGIKMDDSLWIDDTEDKDPPLKIGTDSRWKSLSSGFAQLLAIREDGTLWQFLRGIEEKQIGSDSDWINVSNGSSISRFEGSPLSAAIKENGTLWTFSIDGWGMEQLSGNDWEEVWVNPYRRNPDIYAIKRDGSLWTTGPGGRSLVLK